MFANFCAFSENFVSFQSSRLENICRVSRKKRESIHPVDWTKHKTLEQIATVHRLVDFSVWFCFASKNPELLVTVDQSSGYSPFFSEALTRSCKLATTTSPWTLLIMNDVDWIIVWNYSNESPLLAMPLRAKMIVISSFWRTCGEMSGRNFVEARNEFTSVYEVR